MSNPHMLLRKNCWNLTPRVAGLLLTAAAAPFLHAGTVMDLRITEVDTYADEVEVTNFATTEVTLAEAAFFCHRRNYATSIAAGTTWTPGESKVVAVADLHDTVGDVWLYQNALFNDPANLVTGIVYGGTDFGLNRISEAVAAGAWPDGSSFVASPGSGEVIQLTGADPTVPGQWSVTASSGMGQYFGTGDAIGDPLPDVPTSAVTIGAVPFLEGLASPINLEDPDDGTNRLFLAQQVGTIHVIRDGELELDLFLDVSQRMVELQQGFDERGLIGFVLHPDFVENGLIYTYTSEPAVGQADFTLPAGAEVNHHGVIAEWQVDGSDPDRIDVSTRRELMRFEEPQFNHNGGQLGFGPDGLLYIALGDGGGRDDEPASQHGEAGNGQNPDSLLGSILRIDVSGSDSANGAYGIPEDNPFADGGGLDEIYAYGLRNPFRFSFDGDMLYAADVGQGFIEEINLIEAGGNYGWRLKEGSFFFDPAGPSDSGFVTTIPTEPLPPNLLDPIAEYDHDDGISIIGGYVYRGTRIPALGGLYVFGDFGTGAGGRMFHLNSGDGIEGLPVAMRSGETALPRIKGFSIDARGELYLMASGTASPFGTQGAVYRLVPEREILSALLRDASFVYGNWYRSGWFGFFAAHHYPWIFHPKLGYHFAGADQVSTPTDARSDFWFFSARLATWVYHDADLFPYVYHVGEGWVFYNLDLTPAWYYALGAGQWVIFPGG